MLFRIKLISDEVENFLREYLIEDDATFLDLNRVILASCGYPDDQITSFYLCDEEWERKKQVTREDMSLDRGSSYEEDIFVMETTRLNELIEEEDQKLEPITTEQEWKVIETILNTLQEEIKKKIDTANDEEGNNEQ